MKHRFNILLNVVVLTFSFGFETIISADWPRWRGPDHNGIASETGWNPKALNSEPKKAWEINVGDGWSAVVTLGKRLYTMGNIDDNDIVYCLNVDTGKEIWRYSYKCNAADYPGPRATPVLDNGNIFTISRDGQVHCLEAAKGTLKWRKNIAREFGADSPTWGFACSPRIEEDVLLINACTHGIALNKMNGNKIWASQPGTGGYAVPVVYLLNNKKNVVIFGMRHAYGVDFNTGKLLWSYPWETEYDINAADPIVIGSQVFLSSGYNAGCVLLDISTGVPVVVWRNKNMSSHFGSSVYLNGFIFGPDGNVGRRSSSLNCLDARTGQLLWSEKLGFNSIIAAAGKLISINERGDLFIVEATKEGYQELSMAHVLTVPRGTVCWTAPVLSNGRIYCRNSVGDLVSIDVSK